MKQILLCLIAVIVLSAASPAQSKDKRTSPVRASSGGSQQAFKYYFDITRPDCCVLPDEKWQKIAEGLKTSGIPAFSGHTKRSVTTGTGNRRGLSKPFSAKAG